MSSIANRAAEMQFIPVASRSLLLAKLKFLNRATTKAFVANFKAATLKHSALFRGIYWLADNPERDGTHSILFLAGQARKFQRLAHICEKAKCNRTFKLEIRAISATEGIAFLRRANDRSPLRSAAAPGLLNQRAIPSEPPRRIRHIRSLRPIPAARARLHRT